MSKRWCCGVALAGVMALLPLVGCTVHAGVPVAEVVVAPGYYFDDEYYDDFGVFHPRAYWYYDGHRWDHRGGAPAGFVVHARPGGFGGGFHGGGFHGGDFGHR